MEKKNRPFSNIRIVFRRTSPLVKCVVLTVIIAGTVTLLTVRANIRKENQSQADLEQQARQLAQENRELTKNIAQLGTVESVKRIAETELGLVDPNTQFFVPSN